MRRSREENIGEWLSLDIVPRMCGMTSHHGYGVFRFIGRLVGTTLLAVGLVPTGTAQSNIPRFERGDCLLNGDWARNVRRECGWLVVPESRNRPDTKTIRLAVEIFRGSEPNGALPLVLLHGGPGGRGGIRMYSAGVALSPLPKHRDVIIYDQRGAGLSEPTLCPAYDRVAESAYNLRDGAEKDARMRAARRACIAELDAKHIDRFAYNTAASGADLIDLRRALGYAERDIRGVSSIQRARSEFRKDGGVNRQHTAAGRRDATIATRPGRNVTARSVSGSIGGDPANCLRDQIPAGQISTAIATVAPTPDAQLAVIRTTAGRNAAHGGVA